MRSTATSVRQYLEELPDDRREALETVRKVVLENLPEGYEEGMFFGMIGYCIPLERYPKTYNGQPLQYVGLASQKNYMALYLTNVWTDPEVGGWFEAAYARTGKRLDMGKSCLRFRKVDDLALDVIGQAIKKTPPDGLIAIYDDARKRKVAGAPRKGKS